MTNAWPDRLVGTDRTGDPLLNLDDACIPFRVAIMRTQWYSMFLVGMPGSPIHHRWDDRYRNPQFGDLAYVPDRALTDHRTKSMINDLTTAQRMSFGYYLGQQREPIHTPEEWVEVAADYDGEDCPTERVHYLQYGPNPDDVCRWANAQVCTIATATINDQLWGWGRT